MEQKCILYLLCKKIMSDKSVVFVGVRFFLIISIYFLIKRRSIGGETAILHPSVSTGLLLHNCFKHHYYSLLLLFCFFFFLLYTWTFVNTSTVLLSSLWSKMWPYVSAPIVLYVCVWFAHHTPNWGATCAICFLQLLQSEVNHHKLSFCHFLLLLWGPSYTLKQHRSQGGA